MKELFLTRFTIPLLLAATVLAVFWPVLQADFVEWDDGTLIYANKYYQPVTTENLLHFWKHQFQHLYVPVTYTVTGVLAFIAQVPPGEAAPPSSLTARLDPHVFHTFSLLVHLLSTLLTWILLRRLTKSDWGACAGAMLWALHPMQVETVAWAGETKGLLAGFFSISALNLYLRFREAGAEPQSRIAYYFAASMCFLLALLSKPSAVCLPFVVAALDFLLLRQNARRVIFSLSPWVVIAALFVLVARGAQPVPPEISPLWGRPFVAGDALAFYLSKLVFPDALQMIYGRTPTYILDHWWGYLTWLVPLIVALLTWKNYRVFPSAFTGFAVFVAALLPNLGIVPFIYQRFSTVADRYVYLAMLGPALLLAVWVASHYKEHNSGSEKTRTRRKIFAALVTIWLLLLGVRTAIHVPNWRDSLSLWSYNIGVNPDNWALVNNVGVRELEQGRPAQALVHLEKAARLRPDDPEVRGALATAKFQLGRTEEAKQDFQKALQTKPEFGRALLGLGNVAQEEGQVEQAQEYYRQALNSKLESEDAATAHTNLGAILSSQNRQDEAIAHFTQALKEARDDAQVHDGLALALARKGEVTQAETHWKSAIELDSDFATARINYGTLLAMQNRTDEAAQQWREALRLLPDSASEKASAHHNLALILWGRGESEEAIDNWREALRLNPEYSEARRALQSARKALTDTKPRNDKR